MNQPLDAFLRVLTLKDWFNSLDSSFWHFFSSSMIVESLHSAKSVRMASFFSLEEFYMSRRQGGDTSYPTIRVSGIPRRKDDYQ